MSVGKHVGYSDFLRKEAVVQSIGSSTDAPVPCARWQECEASVRAVKGAVHNAGGFADAGLVEGAIDCG